VSELQLSLIVISCGAKSTLPAFPALKGIWVICEVLEVESFTERERIRRSVSVNSRTGAMIPTAEGMPQQQSNYVNLWEVCMYVYRLTLFLTNYEAWIWARRRH